MTKIPQLISSSRYLLSISYRKLHLKTESSVHLDSLAANTVLHLHKVLRRYLENEYQAYYNPDMHNNLLCVCSTQSTYQALVTNGKKSNLLNLLTGYVLLTKLAKVPMPRVKSHWWVCVSVSVC